MVQEYKPKHFIGSAVRLNLTKSLSIKGNQTVRIVLFGMVKLLI